VAGFAEVLEAGGESGHERPETGQVARGCKRTVFEGGAWGKPMLPQRCRAASGKGGDSGRCRRLRGTPGRLDNGRKNPARRSGNWGVFHQHDPAEERTGNGPESILTIGGPEVMGGTDSFLGAVVEIISERRADLGLELKSGNQVSPVHYQHVPEFGRGEPSCSLK
jgi:hypothetical protein